MSIRREIPGITRALLVVFAIVVPALANADWPRELTDGDRPTMAPLLDKVTPAVVNISVTGSVQVRTNPMLEDPFFRRFFDIPQQPRSVPRQSAGSGVIVDAGKGYVLTNHHVVKGADEIEVTFDLIGESRVLIAGMNPLPCD